VPLFASNFPGAALSGHHALSPTLQSPAARAGGDLQGGRVCAHRAALAL